MSKNIEEYLETLYSITTSGKAASTIEISRRLHVSPASVTEMLKKLDDKGYLKYSPYQGALLTKIGLRAGEKMARKHRLLERFLYDTLKLGKEKVHAQACEMEHTLNDDAERALCQLLKHPTRCPDDLNLIPPCDLRVSSCDECQKLAGNSVENVGKRYADLAAISALKENEIGQVLFIRGDERLLRRLSDLGLKIGAKVEVTSITSLKAPLEITIEGSPITIARDIALNVFVEKIAGRDKVMRTQETLSTMNKRLEERNRQYSIMSEMRDLLQSCSTVQEMPPIITTSITRLLPNVGGALFLMSSSRTELQSVARWGDLPEEEDENIFGPDACWSLRRGRIYEVEDVTVGPICPHIKHQPFMPYICLPLIAKGDILGVLHLRTKPSISGEDRWNTIADLKEIVIVLAEYLSLSIANIRLWERLTDQSIRDPLTRLFNRRYLEETIQREIQHATRNQNKIGIIMADVDHFKNFNDKYGHEAGDELLVKLADFFKAKIRGSDVACRYGGEEFILVLPGSSAEGTYKRAESIREEVKNMKVYFHDVTLPSITLSLGTASYPDNGRDLNSLVQVADSALYKAKEQGRDRVVSG